MSISVVIPCFNLGDYVRPAVDSVRTQTRPPEELVIVDDGSDDAATIEMLATLEREGVSVLRQDNAGASAARNAGIASTSGGFVLCLDADDMLLPGFLESTAAALEHEPAAGIAATGVEFFGEVVGTWQPQPHSVEAMLARNCIPSASMFRRECWEEAGGYRDIPGAQDWDLWLAILAQGWRWTVVPEVLYRYRRRKGSISDTRDAERESIMRDLLTRHSSLYRDRWVDVFLELDSQLEHWRSRATRLQNGSAPAEATIEVDEPSQEDSALVAALAKLPPGARILIAGKQPPWSSFPEALVSAFPEARDAAFGGDARPTGLEAIAQLEKRRAEGAEYFVLPVEGPTRRAYDAELLAHLEEQYTIVFEDDHYRVYDVADYHTFSIVICTHNRAALVPDAIASALSQDYPTDRYELIVVDNASTDCTQEVVEGMRGAVSVAYTNVVEENLGLSHARNRGIATARHEYVAFLDDDAVATHHWLRAFNRVVNEYRALVVGGRVEKSFPAGFEPPDWFQFQYLKHHFGVNYRDRGREESVIRIRQPLYLSGGNTAYAKRLFDSFGGFKTEFGRKGSGGLLACEETFLNLQLERHGVPLYYSDDAFIHHHVDRWRVQKKHLRVKSYWSGASNALMHVTFFGYDDAIARRQDVRREAWRLLRRLAARPGDLEAVTWRCRISYCRGYDRMLRRLLRERRRGAVIEPVPEVDWRITEWEQEVTSWPDGPAKYRHLAELALDSGKVEQAEEALRKFEEIAPVDETITELSARVHDVRYERALATFKESVEAVVPAGETLAVVSRGDDELLEVGDRLAGHFPADQGGSYAGEYPADSAGAIVLVEKARVKGARFLAFPQPALWWLDYYEGLRHHLDTRYRSVEPVRGCLIFDLRESSHQSPRAGAPARSEPVA